MHKTWMTFSALLSGVRTNRMVVAGYFLSRILTTTKRK